MHQCNQYPVLLHQTLKPGAKCKQELGVQLLPTWHRVVVCLPQHWSGQVWERHSCCTWRSSEDDDRQLLVHVHL